MVVLGWWSNFGFEEHQCSAQATACKGKQKKTNQESVSQYF